MCEAYDILHQERAEDATHVVLPFTREDVSLLRPSVVERWLPADARGAGTPVVTIEFLFDLIAAIKTFDAVLGRQGMAYAVGGLGGDGEEGEIGVTDMTDMTGRCRVGSLKVFGNEMYGASSLPNADSSLTRVEACDESEEQLQSVPDDSEYGGNENLDLNVHTPGTTPGTTPGNDGARELDLKNFAAISSVTPLEESGPDFYDVEDDFGAGHDGGADYDGGDDDVGEVRTGLRTLALQDDDPVASAMTTLTTLTTSLIEAHDIIPGDLLLRAPRNSKVRQRHAVPGGRQTVMYTESITMRPKDRDIVEIDVKSSKNVAMQCGKSIIKPLFFYKLRGENWRVEYRRFYRAGDLPGGKLGLPTDLDPAELFLSTVVEGSSLHSLADVQKVFVDKLSAAGRRPVLEMETAGSGAPAWFYRHLYDVDSGRILYKV